jgi:pimeloyl-ACP methyl ester carboxylesterase
MPYVQAGEVRLHYVEKGSGPEPLVFVHGFTSSQRNWEEIHPYLPDRWHSFFLDLRGAGESDKPASGYGPAVYARDIDLATRALGLDTFTLVGHSMGGLTAMQFAVTYPQRLRRLVLVAPAPSNGLQVDPAMLQQQLATRGDRALRRQMARALAVRPVSDAVVDRRIDDDLKWPETAYVEAWQAMVDIRLGEALRAVTTPTLMVAGDRDFLRAANLEDAQRIPNCALQVFYRVGHEIAADVPEQFVALVDEFITHGAAAMTWEELRATMARMRAEAARTGS